MWPSSTGLKWDPISIANQLAFFHGSNVLEDFQKLELKPDETAIRLLSKQSYQLGYWERGIKKEIWYSIGRTCKGTREYSFLLTQVGILANIHVLLAPEPINGPANMESITQDTITAISKGIDRNLRTQQEDNIRPSMESRNMPLESLSLSECHGGKHAPFCQHMPKYDSTRYP
jgi:hypothetical protein